MSLCSHGDCAAAGVGPPSQPSKLRSTESATHCRETIFNLPEARETEVFEYFIIVFSFDDLSRLAWPPDVAPARSRLLHPWLIPLETRKLSHPDTGPRERRSIRRNQKPFKRQGTSDLDFGRVSQDVAGKGGYWGPWQAITARIRQGTGFPAHGFDGKA